MAQVTDLIGLGEHPLKAAILANGPVVATALGTTLASASQIGGRQYFTICNTGTSGFQLPAVGGDANSAGKGALLGDEFVIANLTAASVALYAALTPAGSTITLYGGAVSYSGTTGVSIPSGYMAITRPFSVSSWILGVVSV